MNHKIISTNDAAGREDLLQHLDNGWEIVVATPVFMSAGDAQVSFVEYVLRKSP